jgi:hypothetical protein
MLGNEFSERDTDIFLSQRLANPCDLPSRMSSGYRLSFSSGKAAQHEADHSLTIAADFKNSWRYGFALSCVGIAWFHTKRRKAFVLPLTREGWNKCVYLKKMRLYGQFLGITLRETSWLGGVIDYH